MLVFLITCCLSFILLNQSLALKPLPPSAYDMRLLSLCFWKDLPFYPIAKSIKNLLFLIFSSRMSLWKKNFISNTENFDMKSDMSVLDLPDHVLECILEKLPPEGLCKMACVCTYLRERCMSGHLWEKHIKNKWARIVGPAAYREWRWHIASRKCSVFFNQRKQRAGLVFNQRKQRAGLVGYLTHLRPLALIRSSTSNFSKRKNLSQVGSIMSWYCALESGKFWFPAQVYNRENGHVGFLLSCYDAELSYNQQTDTFQARYPPLGRRASALEAGVTWDRLRAPPVDTSSHELHISECLNDLQPGDHIEIQWRRNKEFPYGWWYGVVGHVETCDRDANHCQCQNSDTLVLEFNQYTQGSHWRQTALSRKDHREEGNEADGFYGGIRKLCSNEEISMWRKLWPAEVLE